jgi:hypothetical protein
VLGLGLVVLKLFPLSIPSLSPFWKLSFAAGATAPFHVTLAASAEGQNRSPAGMVAERTNRFQEAGRENRGTKVFDGREDWEVIVW